MVAALKLTLVLATLVGLVLLVATATAANTAVVEFRTPGEVVMVIDANVEGESASDMRQFMDSDEQGGFGGDGNGDGTVQQSEVDAFEEIFKGFFSMANESEGAPTGSITVDGVPPKEFKLEALEIRDGTGPVTSQDPIQMHIAFLMAFDVQSGDRHTVRIEADEDGGENAYGGDFTIAQGSLKAPRGYVIESTTGMPPGASLSDDKKSITFEGIPQAASEDLVIVFTKGGGGIPSLGMVGILAVLVAAALAFRRR